METLLIADDEKNIRDGLKCILDWEALGFALCGEAANGEEAQGELLRPFPLILKYVPNIISQVRIIHPG